MIERFRRQHRLEGRLLHGIEFNTVRRIEEFETSLRLDLPDTLHDIIPAVQPDFCLYSAYSSFNNGYSFDGDLGEIVSICRSAPIMLGELGFNSGTRSPAALRQDYRKAISVAAARGVRGIFFWQAFESRAAGKAYGLFKANGGDLQWTIVGPETAAVARRK